MLCESLTAARRAAAIFAFVAGAVRRHEHAAFRASGRAVKHGARCFAGGRRIIMGRSDQRGRQRGPGGYRGSRQSRFSAVREVIR